MTITRRQVVQGLVGAGLVLPPTLEETVAVARRWWALGAIPTPTTWDLLLRGPASHGSPWIAVEATERMLGTSQPTGRTRSVIVDLFALPRVQGLDWRAWTVRETRAALAQMTPSRPHIASVVIHTVSPGQVAPVQEGWRVAPFRLY